MSPPRSRGESSTSGGDSRDYDDAEKGLCDHSSSLPVIPRLARTPKKTAIHIDTFLSPISPVHEGITPFSSTPELSLSWPQGFKAPDDEKAPKAEAGAKKEQPKIGKWILFNLWFNTYRKFFTFVTLLNLTGIVLAAVDRFPYAETHLGALVLGNLLCAVLFRNELFLRCLYMVAIYGLRSVCSHLPRSPSVVGTNTNVLVGSGVRQACSDLGSAACRRYPLWVRPLRR